MAYSTDIANVWNNDLVSADFVIKGNQLDSHQDLVTAITNSLFCNRLAASSDELPNPFSNDRMGWWGDTFLDSDPATGQRIGSRLWLLMRSKSSTALLPVAKGYAEESLAWLVDNKVASSFTVETYFIGNDFSKLAIVITVYRGKDQFQITYEWAWQQSINPDTDTSTTTTPTDSGGGPTPGMDYFGSVHETAHVASSSSVSVNLNAAGLGLPPTDTPFQQWVALNYQHSDRIHYDYFDQTTLDLTKWNPWLGGDYFGNTDANTRFIGRPPNSMEPTIRSGATVGTGPTNGYSSWTMWEFSLDPTTGTPIPSFDAEIYDPYPAGGGTNTSGNHLVTGPGVAYPGGGLNIICSHTAYPAYTLGFGDRFGQPVRLINGSTQMTFRPDFTSTATATETADPGSRVLAFDGGVPAGITAGMKVTDITNPSTDYIAIGGNESFHVPTVVESFTSTTVTLSLPVGSAGVPSGDTIKFQTGQLNRLLPDAPYYVIGDGIPEQTTIVYEDAVALDWTTVDAMGAQDWQDSASSDDGTVVAAVVSNGFIWTSNDSGLTWTQRATSRNWTGVCMSDDGTIQYACANGGTGVYKSTDSGATWTVHSVDTLMDFGGAFSQVACSADGTIVYCTVDGGGVKAIYKSSNSGSTWATVNTTNVDWYGVACSDDGQVVLASEQALNMYISTNGGSTWAVADTAIGFTPVSWGKTYVNSDGTHMIGIINGSFIVTSADTGVTWEKQFGTTIPNGQIFAACQSDDGQKLFYGNLSTSTGGKTIYYSSDAGFHWLPVGGISPGEWRSFTCNNDFTSFVAFDHGGAIHVSMGESPATRLTLSAPATLSADPTMVRFSRFGWVSGFINGASVRWPATGAYMQFRSKYPDTRFGANSQLDCYPMTSSPDGLSNLSIESGYNEFTADDPRKQFLVGFADGTTTGLVTPDFMNDDYHTWGFENWSDIAFTIYLDGQFMWSTSAAVFSGSIAGSTLTVSNVLPINGGDLAVGKWLRYAGSSQRLYLHAGSGSTWTVYDRDTESPVNLTVATQDMAVSINSITGVNPVTGLTENKPNPNMRGENSIGLGTYMMIGSQGFHTLSNWIDHPGPFEWKITGLDMYRLPRGHLLDDDGNILLDDQGNPLLSS